MKIYNKTGKAEKLKSVGTLIIEELGYYDNGVSKRLGKYIAKQGFVEGDDYMFIEMPNPSKSDIMFRDAKQVISIRAYRSHTWRKIKEEIKKVKDII